MELDHFSNLGKLLSLDGGLLHGDVVVAAELMVHQELEDWAKPRNKRRGLNWLGRGPVHQQYQPDGHEGHDGAGAHRRKDTQHHQGQVVVVRVVKLRQLTSFSPEIENNRSYKF